METETNQKRRKGRKIKHLADLYLQTGYLQDAFNYYQTAVSILFHCKDWLWLGGNWNSFSTRDLAKFNIKLIYSILQGSLEGICATSVILLHPENQGITIFQLKTPVHTHSFTKKYVFYC